MSHRGIFNKTHLLSLNKTHHLSEFGLGFDFCSLPAMFSLRVFSWTTIAWSGAGVPLDHRLSVSGRVGFSLGVVLHCAVRAELAMPTADTAVAPALEPVQDQQ